MSIELPIDIDRARIDGFCQKHRIAKLSLFGSILRNDFDAESDVDVIVEFHPSSVPDYFALSDMEEEFSALIDRKVDLRTPGELSPYFRDKALADAVIQYAE